MKKIKVVSNKILIIFFIMISVCFFMFFILQIGNSGSYDIVEVSARNVLNGTFQKNFEKEFSERFPYKNKFITLYNQIKYSIFSEASTGWIVGKNGYLFSQPQSEKYCLGKNDSLDEKYEEYAKKVKVVQEELKKEGKSCIYILTQAKAQIYPEQLPDSYQVALKKNKNKRDTNYNKLKEAFEKYDVMYYDTEEDLKKIKQGKYPVFCKTGHHWNVYSTAIVLKNIFKDMEKRYKEKYPTINVKSMLPGETYLDAEQDIMNLLNLITCKQDKIYYDPEIFYNYKSDKKVFLFGTSFGGQIVDALKYGQGAFESTTYYSYLTTKIYTDMYKLESSTFLEGEVLEDSEIWEDMLESDIIFMEQQGILGILAPHEQFLDYVIDKFKNGDKRNLSTLVGEHWSEPEEWGRWSLGNDCTISLKQPWLNKDTTVLMKLNSYNEKRRVNIIANNKYITSLEIEPQSKSFQITIPKRIVDSNDKIELKFEIEGNLYSPQEIEKINATGPTRQLGIGLSELIIK